MTQEATETGPGDQTVLDRFRLDGRAALVTGGGRGIGRAVALALAEAGADVAVASRSGTELDAVAEEIRRRGRRAWAVTLDVTSASAVTAAADSIAGSFGLVDILVNNAGNLLTKALIPLPETPALMSDGRGTAITDDEWRLTIDTHLTSTFLMARAFVPAMITRRWGRVINMTSITLMRTAPYHAVYAAAKGGIAALTRALAEEWAPYGVTVNNISPGQFRTQMTAYAHDDPRGEKYILRRIPMRRTGNLPDLGACAVFLASDWASYITGQTVGCDGGEAL